MPSDRLCAGAANVGTIREPGSWALGGWLTKRQRLGGQPEAMTMPEPMLEENGEPQDTDLLMQPVADESEPMDDGALAFREASHSHIARTRQSSPLTALSKLCHVQSHHGLARSSDVHT